MNYETKKQAANDWLKQNEKGIAYEHESEIAIRAFKAGAEWREGKAAKLLAEKDAEIERLKLHDIAGYQEGIDCLTRELSQAKELIKEMRDSLAFYGNPEKWTSRNINHWQRSNLRNHKD